MENFNQALSCAEKSLDEYNSLSSKYKAKRHVGRFETEVLQELCSGVCRKAVFTGSHTLLIELSADRLGRVEKRFDETGRELRRRNSQESLLLKMIDRRPKANSALKKENHGGYVPNSK